jgi:superfamily II DNA or RNA helicase
VTDTLPELWPHQKAAVQAAELAIAAGEAAGLVVLPTGCVSGSTVIGLNRAGKGYSRTIARTFALQNHPYHLPTISTMVRAEVGGRIGLHGLQGVVYSGIRTTWTLLLEDGRWLRATPDHEILTRRGFVPLAELLEDDEVVCESAPVRPGRGRKPRYRLVQGLRHHPYHQGVQSRTRAGRKPEGPLYRVAYHRLVAESSVNGLAVEELIEVCRKDPLRAAALEFLDPARVAVHHRDGNTFNNAPANLEVMLHTDHLRHHGLSGLDENLGRGLTETVRVASIQEFGEEPTYDVVCEDPHRNFVGNGIVLHNCGKTGMVLSLARRLACPTLFLVNRDELLLQTLRAAFRFWPEAHAVGVGAGSSCWDAPDFATGRRPDLAVAMVPTLVNRLASVDPERFGLVVADEAHLSVAPTWCKVLDHFRPGFLLGVTATPRRLDGKGLAGRYGREPLYSYSLHRAIADGRLVPVDSRNCLTRTSLDGLTSSGGDGGDEDFAPGQLGPRVNNGERNDLVVAEYLANARGRRAIAFCVDVPHAEAMAAAFRKAGVRCESVTGGKKSEARRPLLDAFARGELEVLTNCEVLTTGFDDPGVSCLLMARPTESRSLYVQMVGRGLRLAPGKTSCVVIDFTDNCRRHKLVSVLDLLGSKKPLANGPRGEAASRGPVPARPDLPLVVSWSLEEVCPWPEVPCLDGYVPTQAWHNDEASEGQVRALASFGLSPAGPGMSKGEASYLIDRAAEYDAAHPVPATPRQRAWLEARASWSEGTGRRQASRLIDLIKKRSALSSQRSAGQDVHGRELSAES